MFYWRCGNPLSLSLGPGIVILVFLHNPPNPGHWPPSPANPENRGLGMMWCHGIMVIIQQRGVKTGFRDKTDRIWREGAKPSRPEWSLSSAAGGGPGDEGWRASLITTHSDSRSQLKFLSLILLQRHHDAAMHRETKHGISDDQDAERPPRVGRVATWAHAVWTKIKF